MQHSAEWIEIQPGKMKFVHVWQPASPPCASVCIVHGLGEHGGRYHPLARDFTQAGFVVTAFDQQGHGASPESRGRIISYESLLADIEAFQAWNQARTPNLPLVQFGHSMGGNLVINYALRKHPPPTGIIASSPMIEQVNPPNRWFVRMARIVLWLAPNLAMRSKIIAERLMSAPEEQEQLKADVLFHSRLTLRLGGGLLDSGAWAKKNAQRLSTPLLLTHGTSDYMTSPRASQEFARRAGSLCQLEILEGNLHDPFRDVNRNEVVARYVAFIGKFTSGDNRT